MFLQSKDSHAAGPTSILAPQHHPRSNETARGPSDEPTRPKPTRPPDDSRLLQLASNPYGTLDVSNIDTMRSLLFAGCLAISAAIDLSHNKVDINFCTTTIDKIVPHFLGTIVKFKISRSLKPPSAESWSRDTAFNIEQTNGATLHCKALTMDSCPQS
uniref:Uncharacterized protein n=1 Tax=Caenorhabditis japonica TaxID=281687 RepID=A0A8R1ITF1_CAEJA